MWFRNLILYRLTESLGLTPEEIAEALTEQTFRHCTKMDRQTFGWESPTGRAGFFLSPCRPWIHHGMCASGGETHAGRGHP